MPLVTKLNLINRRHLFRFSDSSESPHVRPPAHEPASHPIPPSLNDCRFAILFSHCRRRIEFYHSTYDGTYLSETTNYNRLGPTDFADIGGGRRQNSAGVLSFLQIYSSQCAQPYVKLILIYQLPVVYICTPSGFRRSLTRSLDNRYKWGSQRRLLGAGKQK